MGKIIKIKPNKDERAIATLYGKDFDLTELTGDDGKGEFKAFGKTYQFEITSKSRAKRKRVMGDVEPEEDSAKIAPTDEELSAIEEESNNE
jgi:hypothetical protein